MSLAQIAFAIALTMLGVGVYLLFVDKQRLIGGAYNG